MSTTTIIRDIKLKLSKKFAGEDGKFKMDCEAKKFAEEDGKFKMDCEV